MLRHRGEAEKVTWSPVGIDIRVGRETSFSLSDVEESSFPRCPARVGTDARQGYTAVRPSRQPFAETLISRIKGIVEAIQQGRKCDNDSGLDRASRTYQACHPTIRSFLDTASINYLEFLEARETLVGPLTYIDYSFNRNVAVEVSMKLWAPVYETTAGSREVHRLRYGHAKLESSTWADGAAWIVGDGGAPVSVVECGLGDASEALVLDSALETEIGERHRVHTLPILRETYKANVPIPGPDCVRCRLVQVCPKIVPILIDAAFADSTPWARGLSQSDLTLYRTCPSKYFMKSQNLPADREFSEQASRGIRIHAKIAARHRDGLSCDPLANSDDPEDEPFLSAHASVCDRTGPKSLAIERTLVGWDATLGDVIFMKPDEIRLQDDGTLILRDIKTTDNPLVLEAEFAWEQYADATTWWIALLKGGLMRFFGATRAEIHLEVLTPLGGTVHRIDLDDPTTDFRLEGWKLDTISLWLSDRDHFPSPHVQKCSQCEFLRWCREGQSHI